MHLGASPRAPATLRIPALFLAHLSRSGGAGLAAVAVAAERLAATVVAELARGSAISATAKELEHSPCELDAACVTRVSLALQRLRLGLDREGVRCHPYALCVRLEQAMQVVPVPRQKQVCVWRLEPIYPPELLEFMEGDRRVRGQQDRRGHVLTRT